jgi:acyl-CoA thioester hydrolase
MQQIGDEFIYPVRVYYEDTDAGGVVYYSNYLNFMERARTEWLRHMGYEQSKLVEQLNVAFVVRRVEVDYLKPAGFDAMLSVHTHIVQLGKVSFTCKQQIKLNDEMICKGIVKVACVDVSAKKTALMPTEIYQSLQKMLNHA